MSLSGHNIALLAARWTLGALFLFSGFVKAFDPVGTSVFVEKYLATYSLESLIPMAVHIAIALATVEVMLGAMLVMRVAQRYVCLAITLFLSAFTVITLLSATVLPIGDCGCFGDAVRLTPWGTFLKNIVLLPMAVVLWRTSESERFTLRDAVMTCFAAALPLAISIYAFRHLPLIDFMPYKVSVNLRDEVASERQAVRSAERHMVICRHPETEEVREFSADDEAWYGWDVVDARVERGDVEERFSDFRLYDAVGEDCSEQILAREERMAWLCVRDDRLDGERIEAINRLFAIYPKEYIVLLTSVDRAAMQTRFGVDSYSVDAMTLRSMIRSDVGVIIVEDGVIIEKLSFRDI